MYRVTFSEERLNVQERALLLALHRGAFRWRVAAWAMTAACILLAIALGVQSAQWARSELASARVIDYLSQMGLQEQRRSAALQDRVDALESRPAEARFLACRAANADLVDGLQEQQAVIREQQALIDDALRAAQSCQRPTFFANLLD